MRARSRLRPSAAALLVTVVSACAAAPPNSDAVASSAAPSSSAVTATLDARTDEVEAAPSDAIRIKMTNDLRFVPDEVEARAGTVVFYLENVTVSRAIPHNMLIGSGIDEPPIVASAAVLADRGATFTIRDLPPGRYTFWCSVEGHHARGMIGTLTVTP